MCPSGRPTNQSNVVPNSVLMNNLQRMTSEPPESIIWVWKFVIWASGSSTSMKVTFRPMNVAGITVSMIVWEKGMGRALTGVGGARSSTICSPTCCQLLRNSSLVLRNSSLLAYDATRSTWKQSWSTLDVATACWRARMVSMSCCMVTVSPPSSVTDPCLVFLMLLDGSQHDGEWDLVLSSPTVGAKCSHAVDFKGRLWLFLYPGGLCSLLR